jgi:hypothetical protein
LALSGGANAEDLPPECRQPLPDSVLATLATRYSCNSPTVRCVDGHVGQAFVSTALSAENGGRVGEHEFYLRGAVGTPVKMLVFAEQKCAADRLARVTFATTSIKSPNTNQEQGAAGETNKENQKTVSETKEDAKKTKKDLEARKDKSEIPDILKPKVKELGRKARKIEMFAPENFQRITANISVLEESSDPQAVIESLDAVTKELDQVPTWPCFDVAGWCISVVEFDAKVPEGDETEFFTMAAHNLAGGELRGATGGTGYTAGEPGVWPSNEAYVKVDHGDYYWDVGVMFAGVVNGDVTFATGATGATGMTNGDATKGVAFQSMVVGNFYPWGRQRHSATARDPKQLFGFQVGLNSDLTKVGNAVSVGIIFEPVTGFAITGGLMLYQRNTAPAKPDGTQASEHVPLAFFGISIGEGVVGSIKSAAGDLPGNNKKD